MAFSYSFHLSSKSHSVGTVGKVGQVSRHNLREYESADYDRDQIEILRGSDTSILDDVKEIYHEEFDEALERYNEGKRADRKIDDYLQHVSDSRSDCACELIIQVGDKDFWEDKTMDEKKQMSYIFKDQLRSLEKLVPEMKIASAVVHYDESSPHMHVVGVPVADGYQKGLERQVAKTKVFTADRLSYLQDRMRENAERGMRLPQNQNLFAEMELKEKERGRNKDIPKESLTEYYQIERDKELAKTELEKAVADREREGKNLNMLANVSRQLSDERRTEPVIIHTKDGEKAFMPVPELQRQAQDLQGQIERSNSYIEQNNGYIQKQVDQYAENQGRLEEQEKALSQKSERVQELDGQISAKEKQVKALDKVGSKIRSQELDIHTEQVGGMFNKHEATVIEGYSPKELERVFQRANIGSDVKKTVEQAQTDAQGIIKQAQEEAQRQLQQAQQTINQANEVLRGEAERRRKLDEYEKTVKEKNAQLTQENSKLRNEYRAYTQGWTDKEGNRHESIDELRQEVGQVRAELSGLQDQESEVMENLKDLSQQVDRKLAVLDDRLTPQTFQRMLDDSTVTNLVQDTMFETCKQLHKQGLLQEEPAFAFMKLDKKPILQQFKDRAEDFIDKVKDHIQELAERVVTHHRTR